MDARGQIVARLPGHVRCHIVVDHIVGVILEADRDPGEALYVDVADRQPGDRRGARRRAGIILEEAADIVRVDILDMAIAEIGGDATAVPNLSILRRSEEHTSDLQYLMRISSAVLCLNRNKSNTKLT